MCPSTTRTMQVCQPHTILPTVFYKPLSLVHACEIAKKRSSAFADSRMGNVNGNERTAMYGLGSLGCLRQIALLDHTSIFSTKIC